ncbi:hypothetical protein A11M_0114115 [Xanthomonas vasicola pv. vasculorum NCPPB 895]|nr:hypothetical protein A11M_0114115 [Xanthomonas vasicola pv. vasculorum NCPPB 895]KFA33111.1 hypothetical protein KWI_0121670 [Xanthomonas vasicola pv. vasculorum NCPPB 206]KGR55420.1 hypothetical protein NX09_11425 [Xanthomonas vasicola]KGR55665.1 hypothetical protein NX07_00390 [Xanthomonas vasicola]KGT84518.1 hypothetical protein OC00_07970 [Xanthomonas vasicola]
MPWTLRTPVHIGKTSTQRTTHGELTAAATMQRQNEVLPTHAHLLCLCLPGAAPVAHAPP